SESVCGVVCQFDGFGWRAEGHRREHWSKNLLLRDNRSGMHVAKKGRREVQPSRGHGNLRLPERCAFGDSSVHETLYAFELHARDNRADVNGFVERWTDAQRVHAIADLADETLGDAFLHEQT